VNGAQLMHTILHSTDRSYELRLNTLSDVLTYAIRHILIDPVQSLAHANVATTAMARPMTWNIVAGLGYFWAIAQLVGEYNPITAGNSRHPGYCEGDG